MSNTIQHVGELTEDRLDAEARRLVGIEKVHMAQLIAHLAEIVRRKLHLAWGYYSSRLARGRCCVDSGCTLCRGEG